MDVKTKYTVSIDHLIARIDWYQAPTLPERKFKGCALSVGTDAMYDIARRFSTHFLKEGVVSGAFKDEVAAGVWLLGNGG